MTKLGIIAGNGVFPLEVATAARRRGYAVIAVAHRGETDEKLAELCEEITWIRVGELQTMIDAFKRAGSTEGEKLVAALEKTDYVGTVGRVQFYGRDSEYTHAMKYGADYVSGIMMQWQNGKQVIVYPGNVAHGKPIVPFPAWSGR